MKFSLIKDSVYEKMEKVRKFVCKKANFNRFFLLVVLLLFILRIVWPSVMQKKQVDEEKALPALTAEVTEMEKSRIVSASQSVREHARRMDSLLLWNTLVLPREMRMDGEWKKHKVYSVSSYSKCFPDLNDVQLEAAVTLGIPALESREEIEKYKSSRLVFVDNNPYYFIQKLTNSTPYLIPKAAMLLQRIGRNFIDSQYVKQVVPCKMIVTSLLRTRKDVKKLRYYNVNSTEKSCHFYGTTFDISYNKYYPIREPGSPEPKGVRYDLLKYILSEVLNDLRQQGACYVKYERKQGCFHITVR